MNKREILRAFFRVVNRFIIVPAYQKGLGRFISRFIGDVMVLGVVGRKTKKIRYTPVSYARLGDRIYCYQGKEAKGQWYLNILANPDVTVIMPDRTFSGRGEEVSDAAERLKAMRSLLKGSGIFGAMYGFDPHSAPDDVVLEKTKDIHVIRIVEERTIA